MYSWFNNPTSKDLVCAFSWVLFTTRVLSGKGGGGARELITWRGHPEEPRQMERGRAAGYVGPPPPVPGPTWPLHTSRPAAVVTATDSRNDSRNRRASRLLCLHQASVSGVTSVTVLQNVLFMSLVSSLRSWNNDLPGHLRAALSRSPPGQLTQGGRAVWKHDRFHSSTTCLSHVDSPEGRSR